MKSFLIGAATSDSGKTTFTMGMLRALKNRGYHTQPFKCGPDYIDTMFHHLASGQESVNLDTFLSSRQHVKELFSRYAGNSDVAVVEGVMGLFDGYDRWQGSSAEIAMLLDIPVVLIVNAKSAAYSVAPLIYGFRHFNENIRLAGIVFNQVASEQHFQHLRAACEDAGVTCLGYMRRNPELSIPRRHLGLTVGQQEAMEHVIQTAAQEIEDHVDINQILES